MSLTHQQFCIEQVCLALGEGVLKSSGIGIMVRYHYLEFLWTEHKTQFLRTESRPIQPIKSGAYNRQLSSWRGPESEMSLDLEILRL